MKLVTKLDNGTIHTSEILTPFGVLHGVEQTRKKPQFILASDYDFYEKYDFPVPIGTYPVIEWLYHVQSSLVIREREQLECEYGVYRQIIPYTVIVKTFDGVDKFIPYVRTDVGAEEKLHNKASVGWGGHIDLSSVVFTEQSVVDLYETILKSSKRELEEELRVVGDPGASVVWDGALEMDGTFIVSDVGVDDVHLGVIVLFRLKEGVRLEANEPDHVCSHPQTAAEILSRQDWDLENWSRLFLEEQLSNN
jgi:predicted NUDIX family phosphoesterase